MCPCCNSELVDRRGKLICPACHTIVETCCEGGRCTYEHEQDQVTVDRWKEHTRASAEKYAARCNKTAN